MAIFNVSKKVKKEKNVASIKKLVGAIMLGVSSVLFLFSATGLWPWLQSVILGIFGVFCYPLFIALMIISLALMNNRKYVMSKRYAVFLSLTIVFLLAIIQLIIVGNKFAADGSNYSYWQYLALNYSKKWTAGGFLIGILNTSLLIPLNLAGTYVILCLGLVISGAFFAEALISYRKNANLNSPVKINVKNAKKQEKIERESAMKPREQVNVVMNGEIADSLAREQNAKRQAGLVETMSIEERQESYPAYNNETKDRKGGIPEGTSVRDFLLQPPKVDLDAFRAREDKLAKDKKLRERQAYEINENKNRIDRNFADLKGQDNIRPTEHFYEEQYDFAPQQSFKRASLPDVSQEQILFEADNIMANAVKEEIEEIKKDGNDDFIIKNDDNKFETVADQTPIEEPKQQEDDLDSFISSFDENKEDDDKSYISFDDIEKPKQEINSNFTTRTDGYLRDNTSFSRDRNLPENRARDRQLENLASLTDRSSSRDNLTNLADRTGGRESLANLADRSNRRFDVTQKPASLDKPQERFKPYKYSKPSIDLITTVSDDLSELNADVPQRRIALENTLEKFGIPAKVQSVVIGPTVTRYELSMPEGISVKRVLTLDQDIALSLCAKGQIRIEAPIPGRSIVGIEVPNNKVAKVSIKDVLMSKEFTMSPSPLAFALGKDITGTVRVCNLAKMPHLLVAGTTGSGKSVCLNSIIVSMIYKASPDELKFIMIDPKQVELSMYEGLPHMVIPKVITDATKAVNALQWAVDEMERRFNLISEARVRNIDEYNKIDDVVSGKKKKMPYLVIIFDEFADFMLVAKNEIDDKIMRLAQKARAAGIHLILATQRPSADIVTGTIKANFPARIAFKVASRVDSEVIMGSPGAEKLLGYGDMLYKPSDSAASRIQGCFIDTPETKDIVNYIIQNNEETYDEDAYNAIFNPGKPSGNGSGEDASIDPLLPQALKICIDVGVASTTMVQRKLSIGYPRAARIIDQMEERGYISSAEGSKQRTVYTSIEEFYEIFGSNFE